MDYTLEICANSVASAVAAQDGGADRVELCQSLEVGGVTPSYGQIKLARQSLHIGIHVLIRPRAGDFVYSSIEFEEMKADIIYCKEIGCDGVVFGLLLPDGTVDEARTSELASLASPMQVTFHRAFDVVRDPSAALESIVKAGCTRLLTSGMRNMAVEGAELIAELIVQARGRIEIMPGSGIDESNILPIARATGARAFHTSAKIVLPGSMDSTVRGVDGMGGIIWRSSKEKIRRIADLLKHRQ